MLHEEILLATRYCNLQLRLQLRPRLATATANHILPKLFLFICSTYIILYFILKYIRYTNFQNVKTLMDEFFTFAGSLSWLWIWISSLIHLGRWNSSRWTKFHYDSTCLKLLNIIPYSLHGCLAQETQQFFVVPSIDRWCMLSYFLYSRAHTLGNLQWRYVFSIK